MELKGFFHNVYNDFKEVLKNISTSYKNIISTSKLLPFTLLFLARSLYRDKILIYLSFSNEELLEIKNKLEDISEDFITLLDHLDESISKEEILETNWISIDRLLNNSNKTNLILANVNTLFYRYSTFNKSSPKVLNFKKGNFYSFKKLESILVDYGYNREYQVSDVGEFSIRGDIIDIYSIGNDYPVRLEFFDDELESIRFFDPNSQRSIKELDEIRVYPLKHFYVDSEEYNCFFDFIQNDIILSSSESIDFNNIFNILQEKNRDLIVSKDILHIIYNIPFIPIKLDEEFVLDKNRTLIFKELPEYIYHLQPLYEKISENKNSKFNYIVYYDDKILKQFKKEKNILKYIKGIYKGYIPRSIEIQPLNIILYSIRSYENIIYKPKKNKVLKTKFISYDNLKFGDLIVHEDYGIGRFKGIETIYPEGNKQECFVLEYQGGDTLYVPLEDFHKIQKYSSPDSDEEITLDALGSKKWENTKKRLKQKLEKLSEELIIIQAKREASKREPYKIDIDEYKRFSDEFIYDLTPDQKKAIEDIERDLSSPYFMDRLICGDVGFGKTEVAMRAAFLAVYNGRQVAVIVPTTVLAHQHYNTFRDRMKNFPINIEVYSRHTSKVEEKRILKELKEGKIDIIIGTHKLLSSKVIFKNLGLLIIDEEQRFGVSHKNKLLKYRYSIDVLSMTATPIPRTLSMALNGIKDLSIIATPPKNRLRIETFIKEFDDNILKYAIERELQRGGQVFFVHNRIEELPRMEEHLSKLVPFASVVTIHGSLSVEEIEERLERFINKEYDILLTTTIIENGIDMPNVNTIIINDSHKYGISQLYQLRGRVGRSDKQAYCYLIIPNNSVLSSQKIKERLTSLIHYTELGSGFYLAMKDLEIRGAGDILGKEQSGFIIKVGFSFYFRMLQEMVEKIKNKKYISMHQVYFYVPFDTYINPSYIEDDEVRATIYHRLSNITRLDELKEIEDELIDRFSTMDSISWRFFRVIEMRIRAGLKGINDIRILTNNKLYIRWENPDNIDVKRIIENLTKADLKFKFSYESGLAIEVMLKNFYKSKAVFKEIYEILNFV